MVNSLDIFMIISMLGGLAMFLYGMTLLGSGLEKTSGGRLERTLEKLTDTVIKGVLLGALVTAAIQSSSATTVIVVGLVNARVLKLRNAIGVIMGANIGTTVTAHILRLSDLDSSNLFFRFLKPTTLAPLACIVGILLIMTAKRNKARDIGSIFIGFGILFTGMFTMESSVKPLADLPQFSAAFAAMGNIPLLGVLVGAGVTALIQSSSASIGILQALSSTGQITFGMAFPIIMGQNIGTTITPILASIGATKNAKRSACVHVTFNVLGTILFFTCGYALQSILHFAFWDLPVDKGMIANFHTIFNLTVTILFIPFVGVLERIACTIVKDKPGQGEQEITAASLDERLLVSPGLALEHVRGAVVQMALLARSNFLDSVALLDRYDQKIADRIQENEDVVDKLEDRVETYLLKLGERELSESENRSISELLHTCGEFERIADHAQNIAECADRMVDTKTTFSKKATEEMHTISEAVHEILDLAVDAFQNVNRTAAANIAPLEEVVDELEQMLKDKHIDRLRRGKCTVDAAFPYVEALSNIERISDLCSNVGESVLTYDSSLVEIDRHAYKRLRADQHDTGYQDKYIVYSTKYFGKVKRTQDK